MSENPCHICGDYCKSEEQLINGDYRCIHAARCIAKFNHRMSVWRHNHRGKPAWPQEKLDAFYAKRRVELDEAGDVFYPHLKRPLKQFGKPAPEPEQVIEQDGLAALLAGKRITL